MSSQVGQGSEVESRVVKCNSTAESAPIKEASALVITFIWEINLLFGHKRHFFGVSAKCVDFPLFVPLHVVSTCPPPPLTPPYNSPLLTT